MTVAHGQSVALFQNMQFLELARCPHCGTAHPSLTRTHSQIIATHEGKGHRLWAMYFCRSCGGAVVAGAPVNPSNHVSNGTLEVYPHREGVADALPETPRKYLEQAVDTLHAPDGAVMLAASSVDAMLKAKGLKDGSLYTRIDQSVKDGLLTKDMAAWAHQVRLDANDPRHADEANPHHDSKSAENAVEFATALAEILFVLPGRVTRGIVAAGGKPPAAP